MGNTLVLIAMTLTALWTVMARSLLRSAIGLALTSALLTVVMFRLDAPLAAVFELSVCAGLISVIFITTISLTQPLTTFEVTDHMRRRLGRFIYLPFLMALVAIVLVSLKINIKLPLPALEPERDIRLVLWQLRQIDLVGQVAILLAGALGVAIFFKEKKNK
jgi:NADH-quinone oxidoreductase subunit J